jgi:hypothetical protein
MPRRINDQMDVKVAVAASAGIAGAMIGTAIDTATYGRARFVFNFGNGAATTAALSSSIGVWKAGGTAGSATTYSQYASAWLAAVTSGVLSSSKNAMVIDVPTDPSSRWMIISGGSMLSTAIPHSCIVELYNGINRPPTTSAQQLVTV